MVDIVVNSPGLDGPSTIESHVAESAIKKCETFGFRDTDTQMCQIAPGSNVWLCDKCNKEMDEEKVRLTLFVSNT